MMFRGFSAIFLAAFLVTLGQSRPETSNNHAGGLRSARQFGPSFPASMGSFPGHGNPFAARFGRPPSMDSTFPEVDISGGQTGPSLPDSVGSVSGNENPFAALFGSLSSLNSIIPEAGGSGGQTGPSLPDSVGSVSGNENPFAALFGSLSSLDSNIPEAGGSGGQTGPSLPDSSGSEPGIGDLFASLFALSNAMMDSPLVNMDLIKKTECDPDHQSFGDSCYLFSTDKADWVTAQDKCREIGGNLVKISNDNEFNFIKDQMTENRWVGFSDQDSEGQFKWIADGSTFPLNSPWWHNGEPNDRSGKEDCGEFYYMHRTYMLNDNVCTGWELTYICEMELPYIEP